MQLAQFLQVFFETSKLWLFWFTFFFFLTACSYWWDDGTVVTRWTHPWFSFLFGEPHVTRGSLCRTTDTGRFVFVFVFFLAAHILSIRRWRRLSKRPLLLLWPTTAGGLESRDCHVPWQCCRHCLFRMQHSSVAKVMLIFFPESRLFCSTLLLFIYVSMKSNKHF